MDSSKQEKCMPPLRTVEDENSYKFANRKSSFSIPDQKMLKVRIKIGSSDNLSTQNKAALYSGLGLDASPSSLLDESPSESEGMSCGHIMMGFDSPTSIIQVIELAFWVCLLAQIYRHFLFCFSWKTESVIYIFRYLL